MNDKIRELAQQAGDYVNRVYTPPVRSNTPGKIWEDGHVDWHTQFNEKFAELIVKECSEHIRNRAMRAGGACTIVGEESLWLAKDLEEHFGVEE